jgi:hypothetical protein
LSLEDRKRALEAMRVELETIRNGIRTAAIEIKDVEARPDTTDEQALVLNAHLALLLAQEKWMSGIFDRAELAIKGGGTPPTAGTGDALRRPSQKCLHKE